MCIASPILVTGTVKWSQNVYCVSDYCQRLWHMYSCIRSESRRPDVRWHLYILPGNIRYPAEWTGVNVPVVFRMKIKISKSRISLLTSGIICLNLLKNKIFKIWSLTSENTWLSSIICHLLSNHMDEQHIPRMKVQNYDKWDDTDVFQVSAMRMYCILKCSVSYL